MTEIQQALHKYLKEKKLNELFVSIVEAILIDKPESPIAYMAEHLLTQFPEETKELREKLARAGSSTEKPLSEVVANSNCDEELSDSSDESVASSNRHEPSAEGAPPSKKRRESVYAEKITDDAVEESELKVVEKTEEEATKLSEILANNVFFGHLDDHQLKTVQNAMFSAENKDGDVIIRQGDDGDNFYVIDSGTVEVFIDSDDTGERNLVKTCEAGDAFGELAIMYNAPRAASCIAKGEVRLWALDRKSFNVILMKTTIAKRKQMKETLLKIPVFSQLTEYELLTIADTLVEEKFDDGAIVCKQGDQGDRFYLINEGTAVITIGSTEVSRLSSGSYFGEIALLTSKPRQATVAADGELKCFSLNRKTFDRVMGSLAEILKRNIDTYNQVHASNLI